ncbi:MAG: sensor histidine kinase [Actinomycetes bacterium]
MEGTRPGWSLQRRVGLLCALVALFGVLVAAAAGLALRGLTTARMSIVDEIDPALVAGLEARAALATQEAAVRGFVLSGDRAFLDPYERARVDAGEALRQLDRLVRHEPNLVQTVVELRRRIAAWDEGAAAPVIRSSMVTGGRADPVLLEADRQLFEDVRRGFDVLEEELERSRDEAQRDLDGALRRFVTVAAAGVVAFLIVAALCFVLLRRWVTDPIRRLAGDTRQVAAGELDHVIEPVGPPEVASLGRDVEAMRKRITSELAAVEAARAALDDQREELQRSNAELEQFAYVASHDLQEPLRKVASFCQLIEKRYADQLDDRGRQYIDYAVDGAKRMQALINDLLTFSRVGRTTDRFRPVELGEVADAAVRSLAQAIEDSNATVTVAPLPTVNGDPILLTAVLQNLIGNAIKFRSEEPPVVEIGAERDGDMWVVNVTDNGIGIPDEYAERIFVIFQRLHAREEYEGTGIGLSLCRKIVEFHGGRIAVDRGRASGTSVSFTLPAAEPEPQPADPPVPQEATSR